MNEKLELIHEVFERDFDFAFPKTSERKMKLSHGSYEFIRHQFINTVTDYFKKQKEDVISVSKTNPKKYKQILDKIKKKYYDLYEELDGIIYEMEDRIYDMAKDDYAIEKGIEDEDPEEIDREDIPPEMIASFIQDEWHHNMVDRYDWAKDYFPYSKNIITDNYDPFGTFISKYVIPIEKEITDIYEEFLDINKRVKDNIKKNHTNIFDFVFGDSNHLQWDFIRGY